MDDEFPTNMEVNKKDGFVLISVNPKIYPLDIVLAVAYRFISDNYVLVDGDPAEELIVEIRPRKVKDLQNLGREFNSQLVKYANYTVQAIKNQRLREAILDKVMLPEPKSEPFVSPSEALVVPQEDGSVRSDSNSSWKELKVLPWESDTEDTEAPWEEKYGKD